LQLRKCDSSSATKTPPLIAASIHRNTSEPWIKRAIDVKRLQRKVDLAQYELKNIIRIGCRACMPANETQQLMLVLAYQILKSHLIAVFASTDKRPILQV
jgi:hypothetical protein